MRIYVSGGCKSGKSSLAQRLAKKMQRTGCPLYYLATMVPVDEEDRLRIERHRREREGWGFETIEITSGILTDTTACDSEASFLLDSVTALLADKMFDVNGHIVRDAPEKIASELAVLAGKAENIVFVSDYIYSDACIYDDTTEAYRKGLAWIDRALSALCDFVLEVASGHIVVHEGARTAECNERRRDRELIREVRKQQYK